MHRMTVVTGFSGAGKTTLCMDLLRGRDPRDGPVAYVHVRGMMYEEARHEGYRTPHTYVLLRGMAGLRTRIADTLSSMMERSDVIADGMYDKRLFGEIVRRHGDMVDTVCLELGFLERLKRARGRGTGIPLFLLNDTLKFMYGTRVVMREAKSMRTPPMQTNASWHTRPQARL